MVKQVHHIKDLHARFNELYQFDYLQKIIRYLDLSRRIFLSENQDQAAKRKALGQELLSENDDALGVALIGKLEDTEFKTKREMRNEFKKQTEIALFDFSVRGDVRISSIEL